MKEISREAFVKGLVGTGMAYMLGSCAHEHHNGQAIPENTLPGVDQEALQESNLSAIDRGATATKQAVRLDPPDPPKPLPPPQTWRPGDFVLKSDVDFPGVALNYDDGPSPYNTDPILRTLAKYGIKATFYVIGVNAIAWPNILRRIRDEGHEIGNHSYRHSPYKAYDLALQIPQNQKVVRDITGVNMVSARAPGLTRGQFYLDTCRNNGLYEVHTTIDSLDWKSPRISANSIINNILGPMHWGAIPLQHDGGNRRPTADAQEQLIRSLIYRGYQFDTVTNLINRGRPNPGTPYYASVQQSRLTSNLEIESDIDAVNGDKMPIAQNGIACNYNPEVELNMRLNELKKKVRTKSEESEYNDINDALKVLKAG